MSESISQSSLCLHSELMVLMKKVAKLVSPRKTEDRVVSRSKIFSTRVLKMFSANAHCAEFAFTLKCTVKGNNFSFEFDTLSNAKIFFAKGASNHNSDMLYPQFENRDGELERPKPMGGGLKIPPLGLVVTDGDGKKFPDDSLVRDLPREVHVFIAVGKQLLPSLYSSDDGYRALLPTNHRGDKAKLGRELARFIRNNLKGFTEEFNESNKSTWGERDFFDAYVFYNPTVKEFSSNPSVRESQRQIVKGVVFELCDNLVSIASPLTSYCLYGFTQRFADLLDHRDTLFELCQNIETRIVELWFEKRGLEKETCLPDETTYTSEKRKSHTSDIFNERIDEHLEFILKCGFDKREMLIRLEKLRINIFHKKLDSAYFVIRYFYPYSLRHARRYFAIQDVISSDASSYSDFARCFLFRFRVFGASYPKNQLADLLQNVRPTSDGKFKVDMIDWKAVEDSVGAGEDEKKSETTGNGPENTKDVKKLDNNADGFPKNDDAKSDASSEFVFGWGKEKAASECSEDENADGDDFENANTKSEENKSENDSNDALYLADEFVD